MERCNKTAYWVGISGMFLCDSCHASAEPNHFTLDRFAKSIGKCDKPTETIAQFRERQRQGIPQNSSDWR